MEKARLDDKQVQATKTALGNDVARKAQEFPSTILDNPKIKTNQIFPVQI